MHSLTTDFFRAPQEYDVVALAQYYGFTVISHKYAVIQQLLYVCKLCIRRSKRWSNITSPDPLTASDPVVGWLPSEDLVSHKTHDAQSAS